jgi:hypothetical protein
VQRYNFISELHPFLKKNLGEGIIPLRNGSQREVKTKEILDKKIPTDYTDYTD